MRDRSTYLGPPALRRPGFQDADLLSPPQPDSQQPSSIAFLWEGEATIPSHRQAEAMEAWQGARQRARDDAAAGQELVALTRELARAQEDDDPYRARAFLDVALEHVSCAQQRTALLASMVRMAVRTCDLQSAKRWLRHIEPGADLESDSEWRLAMAVVATLSEDYDVVLSAVGSTFDSVAIAEHFDAQAAVFRVHALEQMGDVATARKEMKQALARSPGARTSIEATVATYEILALCPKTLPWALAEHERRVLYAGERRSWLLGVVLIALSVLPPAALGVLAIVRVAAGPSNRTPWRLWGTLVVFGILLTLGFLAAGVRELRRAQLGRAGFAAPENRAASPVLSLVRAGSGGNEA